MYDEYLDLVDDEDRVIGRRSCGTPRLFTDAGIDALGATCQTVLDNWG